MKLLDRIEILAEIDTITQRLADLRQRVEVVGTGERVRAVAAVDACNGKRHYRSLEAAGQAAESAKNRGSTDSLRIYQCGACQMFHLTKVGLLDQANFEERIAS